MVKPMRVLLEGGGWLLLAVVAAWLALSVPVHFRAVAPGLLAAAGEGTPQVATALDEAIRSGQIGPAARLIATGVVTPDARQAQRLETLLDERPFYRVVGGPDPFLEAWAQTLPEAPDAAALPDNVAAFILPQTRRASLTAFLETSANLAVQEILATRQAAGYTRFLPVNTPAGGPLETAILLAALLEQTGTWPPDAARELDELAHAANRGHLPSLARLEGVYAALLSSARRLDWLSLQAWVEATPTLESFAALAALAHVDFVALPPLFAGVRLAEDAPALVAYLERQRADGWAAFLVALPHGAGALAKLTSQNQPLYETPVWAQALPGWTQAGAGFFERFAHGMPRLAFLLKLVGLFGAGFALAMALTRLIELLHRRPRAPVRARAIWLSHAALAVALGGLLSIFFEPKLLELPTEQTGGNLRLNLASVFPTDASGSPSFGNMIDQVTLLVLLIFGIVQLMIFGLCLVKLTEIKRQPVSAATRLRLLDNEENLFDLGLYVGLGGTVSSLILVVLDLVSASLMAAYASTLFGIIFVATLKVLFLRPLRRALVLEDAEGNPES